MGGDCSRFVSKMGRHAKEARRFATRSPLAWTDRPVVLLIRGVNGPTAVMKRGSLFQRGASSVTL